MMISYYNIVIDDVIADRPHLTVEALSHNGEYEYGDEHLCINRNEAKALATVLSHFAEYGTLPEEETKQ